MPLPVEGLSHPSAQTVPPLPPDPTEGPAGTPDALVPADAVNSAYIAANVAVDSAFRAAKVAVDSA